MSQNKPQSQPKKLVLREYKTGADLVLSVGMIGTDQVLHLFLYAAADKSSYTIIYERNKSGNYKTVDDAFKNYCIDYAEGK